MNETHPWMSIEDFDLKPGDKMIVKGHGRERVATIGSITRTIEPVVRPAPLTRWQRLQRYLTPRRWRKPLHTLGPTQDVLTIKTDGLWKEVAKLVDDITQGEKQK